MRSLLDSINVVNISQKAAIINRFKGILGPAVDAFRSSKKNEMKKGITETP
jgi:hypothetical protein